MEGDYARGGGGSGTIGVGTGNVRTLIKKLEMTEGATIEVERARTATGPTSETRAAVVESLVLRHEQDAFDVGFVGCIGHSRPSPCEQVQDCSAAIAVSLAQSDTDVGVNTDSWNRSHPPTICARCFRTLRMISQLSILPGEQKTRPAPSVTAPVTRGSNPNGPRRLSDAPPGASSRLRQAALEDGGVHPGHTREGMRGIRSMSRRDPMCSRVCRERPWSAANIMNRAVRRRRQHIGPRGIPLAWSSQ
jgi:hypothetical protein